MGFAKKSLFSDFPLPSFWSGVNDIQKQFLTRTIKKKVYC